MILKESKEVCHSNKMPPENFRLLFHNRSNFLKNLQKFNRTSNITHDTSPTISPYSAQGD